MPYSQTIEAFAQALDDPTRPPPAETRGGESEPDGHRFAIYRNNIAMSLIGAVEARYPVTRRLVGDTFFRAMARAFVARNKPQTPVIVHYGADFADFVAQFEPARPLAYLADVARLENAWVEAYHAADAESLTLDALDALDPQTIGDAKFTFHPAARLLRSDHPAASIWAGHQGEGDAKAPDHWRGEEILATRPAAEVSVRVLPAAGYAFARALQTGATLGEAHAHVDLEGFDPGGHLVGLVAAGALLRIQI
jgi:hypothetical protein